MAWTAAIDLLNHLIEELNDKIEILDNSVDFYDIYLNFNKSFGFMYLEVYVTIEGEVILHDEFIKLYKYQVELYSDCGKIKTNPKNFNHYSYNNIARRMSCFAFKFQTANEIICVIPFNHTTLFSKLKSVNLNRLVLNDIQNINFHNIGKLRQHHKKYNPFYIDLRKQRFTLY